MAFDNLSPRQQQILNTLINAMRSDERLSNDDREMLWFEIEEGETAQSLFEDVTVLGEAAGFWDDAHTVQTNVSFGQSINIFDRRSNEEIFNDNLDDLFDEVLSNGIDTDNDGQVDRINLADFLDLRNWEGNLYDDYTMLAEADPQVEPWIQQQFTEIASNGLPLDESQSFLQSLANQGFSFDDLLLTVNTSLRDEFSLEGNELITEGQLLEYLTTQDHEFGPFLEQPDGEYWRTMPFSSWRYLGNGEHTPNNSMPTINFWDLLRAGNVDRVSLINQDAPVVITETAEPTESTEVAVETTELPELNERQTEIRELLVETLMDWDSSDDHTFISFPDEASVNNFADDLSLALQSIGIPASDIDTSALATMAIDVGTPLRIRDFLDQVVDFSTAYESETIWNNLHAGWATSTQGVSDLNRTLLNEIIEESGGTASGSATYQPQYGDTPNTILNNMNTFLENEGITGGISGEAFQAITGLDPASTQRLTAEQADIHISILDLLDYDDAGQTFEGSAHHPGGRAETLINTMTDEFERFRAEGGLGESIRNAMVGATQDNLLVDATDASGVTIDLTQDSTTPIHQTDFRIRVAFGDVQETADGVPFILESLNVMLGLNSEDSEIPPVTVEEWNDYIATLPNGLVVGETLDLGVLLGRERLLALNGQTAIQAENRAEELITELQGLYPHTDGIMSPPPTGEGGPHFRPGQGDTLQSITDAINEAYIIPLWGNAEAAADYLLTPEQVAENIGMEEVFGPDNPLAYDGEIPPDFPGLDLWDAVGDEYQAALTTYHQSVANNPVEYAQNAAQQTFYDESGLDIQVETGLEDDDLEPRDRATLETEVETILGDVSGSLITEAPELRIELNTDAEVDTILDIINTVYIPALNGDDGTIPSLTREDLVENLGLPEDYDFPVGYTLNVWDALGTPLQQAFWASDSANTDTLDGVNSPSEMYAHAAQWTETTIDQRRDATQTDFETLFSAAVVDDGTIEDDELIYTVQPGDTLGHLRQAFQRYSPSRRLVEPAFEAFLEANGIDTDADLMQLDTVDLSSYFVESIDVQDAGNEAPRTIYIRDHIEHLFNNAQDYERNGTTDETGEIHEEIATLHHSLDANAPIGTNLTFTFQHGDDVSILVDALNETWINPYNDELDALGVDLQLPNITPQNIFDALDIANAGGIEAGMELSIADVLDTTADTDTNPRLTLINGLRDGTITDNASLYNTSDAIRNAAITLGGELPWENDRDNRTSDIIQGTLSTMLESALGEESELSYDDDLSYYVQRGDTRPAIESAFNAVMAEFNVSISSAEWAEFWEAHGIQSEADLQVEGLELDFYEFFSLNSNRVSQIERAHSWDANVDNRNGDTGTALDIQTLFNNALTDLRFEDDELVYTIEPGDSWEGILDGFNTVLESLGAGHIDVDSDTFRHFLRENGLPDDVDSLDDLDDETLESLTNLDLLPLLQWHYRDDAQGNSMTRETFIISSLWGEPANGDLDISAEINRLRDNVERDETTGQYPQVDSLFTFSPAVEEVIGGWFDEAAAAESYQALLNGGTMDLEWAAGMSLGEVTDAINILILRQYGHGEVFLGEAPTITEADLLQTLDNQTLTDLGIDPESDPTGWTIPQGWEIPVGTVFDIDEVLEPHRIHINTMVQGGEVSPNTPTENDGNTDSDPTDPDNFEEDYETVENRERFPYHDSMADDFTDRQQAIRDAIVIGAEDRELEPGEVMISFSSQEELDQFANDLYSVFGSLNMPYDAANLEAIGALGDHDWQEPIDMATLINTGVFFEDSEVLEAVDNGPENNVEPEEPAEEPAEITEAEETEEAEEADEEEEVENDGVNRTADSDADEEIEEEEERRRINATPDDEDHDRDYSTVSYIPEETAYTPVSYIPDSSGQGSPSSSAPQSFIPDTSGTSANGESVYLVNNTTPAQSPATIYIPAADNGGFAPQATFQPNPWIPGGQSEPTEQIGSVPIFGGQPIAGASSPFGFQPTTHIQLDTNTGFGEQSPARPSSSLQQLVQWMGQMLNLWGGSSSNTSGSSHPPGPVGIQSDLEVFMPEPQGEATPSRPMFEP